MNLIRSYQGRFLDGNQRFRYFGGNTYPLIQDNWTDDEYDNFFKYCRKWNRTVVRIWCFNKSGQPTNSTGYFRYQSGGSLVWREATFVTLDRVMNKARKYGIRLILVMADNWPEFSDWGHKQQYCKWSNSIHGTSYDSYNYGADFHLDSNMKTWYKEFLSKVATRVNTVNGLTYSQDPIIFSIELMNEARFVGGTDTNPSTVNSYRLGVLTAWYTEMAAYAKSVFPNHMVGTGSQAQFYDYVADDPFHNGTYYGGDYTIQHQIPNIDYFDFHIYPWNDPPGYALRAFGKYLGYSGVTKAGFEAQIAHFVNLAKINNKPVKFGEIGLEKGNTVATAIPTYPRSDFWDYFLEFWYTAKDADGGEPWHISTAPFDDNNYNEKLDGPHTGGNANGNLNDDDTLLLKVGAAYFPRWHKVIRSTSNGWSKVPRL